ncbi:MAG TPA: polysaccharide deacetylase family protein [Lacunisphaera sp.]
MKSSYQIMHNANIIRILTFHGLGSPKRPLPTGEDNYWLDPVFYEEILDTVKGRSNVMITFDDSNVSDFEIAVPALIKRQLKASFFIVSERIDQPGSLTRDQIVEMARCGMTIGSHGTQHRRWAILTPKELRDELTDSRIALEKIVGTDVREAACPYGSYNRRVLKALKRAGYSRVYTSDGGVAHSEEWLSARNTITRNHTMRDVERMLESKKTGIPSVLRSLKLTLKRWR